MNGTRGWERESLGRRAVLDGTPSAAWESGQCHEFINAFVMAGVRIAFDVGDETEVRRLGDVDRGGGCVVLFSAEFASARFCWGGGHRGLVWGFLDRKSVV